MSVEELAARAKAAMEGAQTGALIAAGPDTPAASKEAKRILSAGQRELREIKRDAAEAERQIKASAQAARSKTAGQGQFIGALMGGKGKRAMSRGRAMGRQSISRNEENALAPYRRLRSAIDSGVAEMQTLKDEVDSALEELKGHLPTKATTPSASPAVAAPPSEPPPPPTPAQWAADPHGRHELRYFDGVRWTEHVSDGGVQSKDRV